MKSSPRQVVYVCETASLAKIFALDGSVDDGLACKCVSAPSVRCVLRDYTFALL